MANKIIAFLLTLATVVFLVINPIIYTGFDRGFYEQFYSDDFKTNAEDQQFLTESVLDYVQGVDVAMVPFSPAEVSHLNDVRNILHTFEIISIAAVIFLVLLIPYIWYYKKDKELALRPVMWGGVISLGLGFIFILCAKFNFVRFFTRIHQVFFPQGNWQFAETDLLIILFPEEVFQMLAGQILTIALVLSALFILLTYLLLYKINKK